MASISSLVNLSSVQFLPICASSSSLFPPFQKTRQHSKPKRHHALRVACSGDTNRRDILIGLGGLYGATSLSSNLSALGAPLSPPDPTNCVTSTVLTPENGTFKIECCPPPPFTDYVIPASNNTQFRIRKAAHLVDDEYIAKYKEAIRRMKALPDDDPRSFKQQAAVHCAYCANGYKQKGFPKNFDVHGSWIFLPFHRWYLYFFERILGSLIGDPTFALPYWTWNHPNGMRMPSIFTTDTTAPLYDPLRDPRHLSAFMDLNYNFGKEDNPHVNPTIKQINFNLVIVYNAMMPKEEDFFGKLFRAGDDPDHHYGSLETLHNIIHGWTGDNTNPNSNGCGKYGQHNYQEDLGAISMMSKIVSIPRRAAPKQAFKVRKTLLTLQLPLTLDSILRTTINRPKVGANPLEKEVLEIELEYDKGQRLGFDVFINDEDDDDIGPLDAEFGGSFVTLPDHPNQTKVSSYSLRIPLNNLLQALDAINDESITVTLCPKYGKKPATIKGIKIERVPLLK
ncbi:hypothetical protein VNO78_11733 [Psophocarpus tetragonolobus]|uniref:Tyrosinase copper-binding domain-containing protein n=1 Tax=Psophocarpus tetragonolobus TaxID=3891 RepID=A0AAN9XNW7_PSOTE